MTKTLPIYLSCSQEQYKAIAEAADKDGRKLGPYVLRVFWTAFLEKIKKDKEMKTAG